MKRDNRFSLTKEQKDIIFGTVLGDGYLNKRGSNVRLQLVHGPAQEHYIKWKAEKLSNLLTPRGVVYVTYNDKYRANGKVTRWNFYTKSHEYLVFLHNLMYSNNGKKFINKEILSRLTPLALYVWLADDGSLYKVKSRPTKDKEQFYNSAYFRICTCSKDGILEDEVIQALKILFNIDAKKRILQYNPHKLYCVFLNLENTKKLLEIVKPYVSGNMDYKFTLDFLGTKVSP